MDIYIIIGILFFHWLADFVFQGDEMAKNKSKNIKWLLYHILIYYLIMLVFTLFIMVNYYGIFSFIWVLINTFLHFIIDYITSKINKYLWNNKMIHEFFVSIGFDQFLHITFLLFIYYILIFIQ